MEHAIEVLGHVLELCHELTVEDEKAFEELFRRLGLSLDWNYQYRTIDDNARATSQQAFLRNLQRGEAYSAEAPGLWDVTFQTAVAQAELESREYPGFYHRIAFHLVDADADAAARAAGWLNRVGASAIITTYPWEARRWATVDMVEPGSTKPGMVTMPPKVSPWPGLDG